MINARASTAAVALATTWLATMYLACVHHAWGADDQAPKIQRVLPPAGMRPPAAQAEQLSAEVTSLQKRLSELAGGPSKPAADNLADVGIYAKAVDFALRFDEFYQPRDIETAGALLRTGRQRVEELVNGRTPWASARGLLVRGYRSRLDDSYQPYGLVIPEKLDLSQPAPLYVWLHGRGDKTTDLHFIQQRQTSKGQIAPPDGIVLHPFGRYCNAFKFAGEVDVFEAIEAVKRNYKIDPDRVVLWGFSMGGAGTWHLAAHYPDRWCAASPGAGFADTRRYQNIQPKDFPPSYEQTLWHLYDVPDYTRNLFNLPVIAYSGENDKQIQAARIMEEAFAAEGHKLHHIIGPGMGHAYHPKTLEELGKLMSEAARKGIDRHPKDISFQTRTLRYNRCHWVELLGLRRHWEDSRVDANVATDHEVALHTKNIIALRLDVPWAGRKTFGNGVRVKIDGSDVALADDAVQRSQLMFAKVDGTWRLAEKYPLDEGPRKVHGLQGPIDDVFMEPFAVDLEKRESAGERRGVLGWCDGEESRLLRRWEELFRGAVRIHQNNATDDDFAKYHLVLFGAPTDGSLLRRLLKHSKNPLPVQWDDKRLVVNGKTYDAKTHVLSMIYPNPLNPKKYVVINSGPTFREGHDHTNSLQTPKLPDWAVIDVRTPPDAKQLGKIVDAGFFDERWQFQK